MIIDGSEDRYATATFSFIKDVEIRVPEELVDEDHPLQFNPFYHYKFFDYLYTEECRKSSLPPLRAYCGL